MKFSEEEFKALKDLIEIAIDEKLDKKLNEKLGLKPGETLQKKLSHLPTKDEFYRAMDKIMKELKAVREEQTVMSSQVSNLNDRVQSLENFHQ